MKLELLISEYGLQPSAGTKFPAHLFTFVRDARSSARGLATNATTRVAAKSDALSNLPEIAQAVQIIAPIDAS